MAMRTMRSRRTAAEPTTIPAIAPALRPLGALAVGGELARGGGVAVGRGRGRKMGGEFSGERAGGEGLVGGDRSMGGTTVPNALETPSVVKKLGEKKEDEETSKANRAASDAA